MKRYRSIAVTLTGVLLFSLGAMANEAINENGLQGKKVLYVYGGWEGHEPEPCRDVFVPWLESEGAEVFLCDDLACYDDSVLMAEVDLIIQHVTIPAFRVKGEGVAECRETWRGFGRMARGNRGFISG